jgi:hypothetical protein
VNVHCVDCRKMEALIRRSHRDKKVVDGGQGHNSSE